MGNVRVDDGRVLSVDVIERIERGEMIVSELVDGKLTKLVPDFNANTELLRLAKIGQRMQWVSVGERLPKKNVLVLLYLNDGEHTKITTGKIYASDDAKYDGEFCIGFDQVYPDFLKRQVVTHWMPLPEPLKEGE